MAYRETRKHRRRRLLVHDVFRGVDHDVEVVVPRPGQLFRLVQNLSRPNLRLHRWPSRSELAAISPELEERFPPDLSQNHPRPLVEIALDSLARENVHEQAYC